MEWKLLLYKMLVAGIVGAAMALPYTLQATNVILSAVVLAFVRGAILAGAEMFQPKITEVGKGKVHNAGISGWLIKHA